MRGRTSRAHPKLDIHTPQNQPDDVPGITDPRYHALRLVDWNGNLMPFNEPLDFENEFFKGQVLFIIKTEPEHPHFIGYFAGKQRLFEMQIQGQFKKLPEGEATRGSFGWSTTLPAIGPVLTGPTFL